MNTKEKGRFGRWCGGIGKALCYLLLFLGWQTAVSSAYTYRAMVELYAGGLPPAFYQGLRFCLTATALFSLLLVAIALVAVRRRGGVRRLLSLGEGVGDGFARAAGVVAALCLVGGLMLLSYTGWVEMSCAAQVMYGEEGMAILDMMGEEGLYDAIMAYTPAISALSGLLTLISLALAFKLRGRQISREVWIAPVSGKLLGWSAALAACLYWLVTLVLAMLPEGWLDDYAEASAGLEDTGLLAVLATAIIAPVVEEVIFRGLIFTRLERAFPAMAAVVLSAVVFGWCHGEFVWFCYAFALGMVFALVTRRCRSILPALVMHVVFNSVNELLLLLLPEWEPGLLGTVLILLVGVAGTLLCGRRVRTLAMAEEERREREAALAAAREREEARRAAAEQAPAPAPVRKRTLVSWDRDSGPGHKFPPNML